MERPTHTVTEGKGAESVLANARLALREAAVASAGDTLRLNVSSALWGKKSECAFEYFSTTERGRDEDPLVALFSIRPGPDAADNHRLQSCVPLFCLFCFF